jgi:TM2 domain-containing membrane protein YozV
LHTIDPGTAAFLSFLIPGWGQMRRGKRSSGLIWLVLVVAGYFLMILPGLILHVFCILEAYWRK